MSKPSKSLVPSDEHGRVVPDYFRYYSREVVSLLSEDEANLPFATQTSHLPQTRCTGEGRGKSTIQHNDDSSGSLYSNGIGAGLSDFKKERLRSLLRQSVTDLSSEVDEMLDPVLAIRSLQSRLRSEKHSSSHEAAVSEDGAVQVPCEKLKVDNTLLASNLNEKEKEEVNDDLCFLLENDTVQVEEIVKKYSDELSGRLGYMEQQLELLLDVVTSKCGPMTLREKQHLQKQIQKLSSSNLERVVEILCRSKTLEKQHCNEIYVDLEKEDNATLWRLYYYVEAIEKAKRLSCSQEA